MKKKQENRGGVCQRLTTITMFDIWRMNNGKTK